MAQTRLIKLSTPDSSLEFESVSGTETLGRSFEYEIFALSKNNDVVFDDLLGHHVTLMMELPNDQTRYLDARIAQIGLVGMTGNYWRYRIVARPWTWILTRTADCKVFQEMTVPEIIEAVFQDHGDVHYKPQLTGNYEKRVYCVQYRETDFDFVSRLMEEEGIYYYFQHEKGKHTMIIVDGTPSHSVGTIPFMPQDKAAKAGDEYVQTWAVSREIQPGATVLRDYDFENPSKDLEVTRTVERPHADAEHEIFDYPGEYLERPPGENLAKLRLDEIQVGYERIEGSANARAIACGHKFTLSGFARKDQNSEYLVLSTKTRAANNRYESGGAQDDIEYLCEFVLSPGAEPYRTPRTTPRPIVRGPQTAVVVGPPPPEEIHVDKYGRIKIQFFWDRIGKRDDKSSCWIRVSQMWAGKQFGWMTIPRIGQEVIVSFLEGNPDDPIVTGRVYNAEQMPPWSLPANKTQSGILTRSTGGSSANANELRFEDKKGSEQVYLHAEKNQDISVENNETHSVGNDRTKTISHDETTKVNHNRTETVGNDETITVLHDRTETVANNETISIGVNRVETVGANETITIGQNRSETVGSSETVTVAMARTHTIGINDALTVGASQEVTVGAMQALTVGAMQEINIGVNQSTSVGMNQDLSVGSNQSIEVGKDHTSSVGKNFNLKVGENRVVDIGKDDKLTVGKTLTIEAADAITIKTGSASITMKKDGTIAIEGKDITVKGSGKVKVQASSDVTIKGSKISNN